MNTYLTPTYYNAHISFIAKLFPLFTSTMRGRGKHLCLFFHTLASTKINQSISTTYARPLLFRLLRSTGLQYRLAPAPEVRHWPLQLRIRPNESC